MALRQHTTAAIREIETDVDKISFGSGIVAGRTALQRL